MPAGGRILAPGPGGQLPATPGEHRVRHRTAAPGLLVVHQHGGLAEVERCDEIFLWFLLLLFADFDKRHFG